MELKRSFICAALLVFATIGLNTKALADSSVEGQYQGRSIYVQSPESHDGFGYCVTRVSVNGKSISSDIFASAFQVSFEEFDLELGDPVMILFEHDKGCKPKLLNPEVLLPNSTFVINEMSCKSNGALSWSTTDESGKLVYSIEQYRWNKWVTIGEVNGSGTPDLNKYLFLAIPHSGENRLRIAQDDNSGKKRISEEITFEASEVNEPELNAIKKDEILEFIDGKNRVKTKYEIFDLYGNIVKKGYNSVVDYSNLKSGVYNVNYDNKTDRIIVK